MRLACAQGALAVTGGVLVAGLSCTVQSRKYQKGTSAAFHIPSMGSLAVGPSIHSFASWLAASGHACSWRVLEACTIGRGMARQNAQGRSFSDLPSLPRQQRKAARSWLLHCQWQGVQQVQKSFPCLNASVQ